MVGKPGIQLLFKYGEHFLFDSLEPQFGHNNQMYSTIC
jgi:hypothetical protein